MTIKRRLFWSNILMIVSPALSALLIGLLCMAFIWLSFVNRVGFGFRNLEDFELACFAVTEAVEKGIERDSDFSLIEPVLRGSGMSITIEKREKTVFSYGSFEETDGDLKTAAEALDGSATITKNGRGLYIHQEEIDGNLYTISLFGRSGVAERYFDIKLAVALSGAAIIIAILASILVANRFLTKFVFKKIEEPLDILIKGVREIGGGNLDYRIEYNRNDEFKAVCGDFNEMAVHLKASVMETQRQEKSRRELIAGISHDIRSPLCWAHWACFFKAVYKKLFLNLYFIYIFKLKAAYKTTDMA